MTRAFVVEVSMKMRDRGIGVSRRSIIKQGVTLVAGIATAGALLHSPPAKAAKAAKSTMLYQGKPHGNQKCSNCIHFVPGSTPTADGTCAVVEGSISPEAWCVAYAPKS